MTGRPPIKDKAPSLADAVWLNDPATQAVLCALKDAGHDTRVVGGAVRNALLGQAVKDIDVATTATPPETLKAANAAGLKTFETGISHGTVTVVAHGTPIEVTTLRRDEDTDGRHARVVFTSDWAEDAARRDFTINALYCDRNGTVHDPLGHGLSDLAARRVRFIGSSEDRIREDYLRILRFFRFTAEYAEGEPDREGHAACARLKDGITNLSGERRRAELLRLLAARRAASVVKVMAMTGILDVALGVPGEPLHLERFALCEQACGLEPDAILRLGVLALNQPGAALALRQHLKLSSIEYERLARMAIRDPAFAPSAIDNDMKAFIYRHGTQAFIDGLMLTAARTSADPHSENFRHRLELGQHWKAPELPVRGADVLALGVEPGPEVGRILSAFEDWWIASAFPMTPALLAKRLQHTVAINKS